jgi:outer membrane protein TolC
MVAKNQQLSGLFVFSCLAFFLLSGCANFRGNEGYMSSKAATPETLHGIDVLELEVSEAEDIESKKSEPAPAELELSLAKCRALVLENNLDLKVQLIEPAIAAARVGEEEARFETTFSAGVNYFKSNTPVASTLDIEGSKMDGLRASLGVNIPLRSGGEINVNLSDNTIETDSAFSIYNPTYETDLSASISQPLLRGAGRRAGEYALRIAELGRQITDAQTKLQVIYAIAEADKAYWRLYAARKLLEVRKLQYDLARTLFEETEILVEVGSRARIELIRTRASVAGKIEAIITAENDVQDRERDLKRKLNKSGLGMETDTVLVQTSEPDPVLYDIERGQMVARALENRMELLEAELRIAQDAATIDYSKNQTLPLVSIGYTYNTNGLGPSRSDAYDLLADNTYRDHAVGLQISIPLGNEAAQSRLRQALYQRTQRLMSRESKKEQITYEVLQQIDKLEATWQRIMASRQTTILYDEQYRAEKKKYELGMVTATYVLDAQTNLAEAQRAEISAIADYQIALIDLAYATGTLLGAAKVQWEPFVP